jgi:hypothetical protein
MIQEILWSGYELIITIITLILDQINTYIKKASF